MQTNIRKAFEVFCGLLLLIAVLINAVEIPLRIFMGFSFDLLFDLPIWITIWAALLISGLLLPDDEHISIDFVRNKFNGFPRKILEIILSLITLGFGLFVTYGSIQYVQTLFTREMVFPRIILIPQWIVQLCVPLGMGIFSFFALKNLINNIRKRSFVNNGLD